MPQYTEAERRKSEYQKWDYITLSDFRSRSSWNWISYVWLWFLAGVSVAVYASDTFTAVNLLAFDNWSSALKPPIPFDISKWIFAGCILFSWVLCIYEWIRALRVMRRANVAESYLDPLAVVLQSMRLGGVGKGWRRFLVFTALTKSKKGADYVALFSYFQFKGAIRILLAEGPRQAINAMTLYSVMKANLLPVGHPSNGDSPIEQFWNNVEILYNGQKEQAIILSTMLFTLVIWVISALSLLTSCLLYIGFLWHYIPRDDGTLSKYCRRKVNTRLERIVNAKAKDEMAREEARLRKAEEKPINGSEPAFPRPIRQPTLPMVAGQDAQPADPSITRTSSQSSGPPPYSSAGMQQDNGSEPTLPLLSDPMAPPPKLFRTDSESTIASNISYGPQPTLPQLSDASGPSGPARMVSQSTVASNVSYGPRQPPGPQPPLPQMPGVHRPPPRPLRMGSQSTVASNISYGPPVASPESTDVAAMGAPPFGRPAPPGRSYTQSSGFSTSTNASDRPLLRGNNPEPLSRNFSRAGNQRQEQAQGPSYEMSTPRAASAPPENQQARQTSSGAYRPYTPANASQQPSESQQPRQPTTGAYRPYSPASASSQQPPEQPDSRRSPPGGYRPYSPAKATQQPFEQQESRQAPSAGYRPYSPANAPQRSPEQQQQPRQQPTGSYRPYSPASAPQQHPMQDQNSDQYRSSSRGPPSRGPQRRPTDRSYGKV